jgi:hypothetical protein
MTYHTRATYRQGVFFPEIPLNLPEDSQVDLVVQGPSVAPPAITDVEERDRILRRVTDRMKCNPLPPDSPKLSRDQLHERR